jgi:cysteine desulfurase
MARSIYLDNNATTRLHPRVAEIMKAALDAPPSNPSSVHAFGREARNKLTRARRTLADLMGCRPSEILFTSSATEALNTLLRSAPRNTITSATEHIAALSALPHATVLEGGPLTPDQIPDDTELICAMAANNETGLLTDIEALASLNIPLVVDAVAHLGKEPLTLHPNASYCFSGHKFHGPLGIGFAIVRHHHPFTPLITGGPQEANRRAGTENLPAVLGLVEAVRIAIEEPAYDHMRALRTRLEAPFEINGTGPRLSNTANLYFPDIEGEGLLMNLDLAGIAVSHGSACSSGSLEPSRVLLAMGYSRQRASCSLRFSLSRFTTEEEIDYTLTLLKQHSMVA